MAGAKGEAPQRRLLRSVLGRKEARRTYKVLHGRAVLGSARLRSWLAKGGRELTDNMTINSDAQVRPLPAVAPDLVRWLPSRYAA